MGKSCRQHCWWFRLRRPRLVLSLPHRVHRRKSLLLLFHRLSNSPLSQPVVIAALTLLLNETYPLTLLSPKAATLHKTNADLAYKSILTSTLPLKVVFKNALIRLLKLLFLSPIVTILIYGLLYLLFTTITLIFQGQYSFSIGSAGLTCLGLGVGCIIGVLVIDFSSDKIIVLLSKSKRERSGSGSY